MSGWIGVRQDLLRIGPVELPALDSGQLHEIHLHDEDQAAALAFALCQGSSCKTGMVVLVRAARRVRFRTIPAGDGLALLGFDPARLTIVEAADELDLLRAGLESARCPGVELILLEAGGRFAGYDLTASRRLALAAEHSQTCVIVLRHDAEPRPSAARTRWTIASAPSVALEADAPGRPAIDVELLRRRGGRADRRWRLEWDVDYGMFRDTANRAPMSGTVVSLPLVRAGAGGHGADHPRAA